ncbi:MAG: hypothetical protein RL213_1457 [Bacteroidota bacterium]
MKKKRRLEGRRFEWLYLRSGLRFAAQRENGNITLVVRLLLEHDGSGNKSEKSMVLADTDIVAGHVEGAALTDDDVSGYDALSAVNLDAKTFAVRFATVLGTTYAFFMCHGTGFFTGWKLKLRLDGIDLDNGQILTVSVLLLISFAALLLENNHLVATNVR